MIRHALLFSAGLCAVSAQAADVTVNFTANLVATTCTITLLVDNASAQNQTVNFGELTAAEITAGGSKTKKDIALQYTNCTQAGTGSLTPNWMKTQITGSARVSGYPAELSGGVTGYSASIYRTSNMNSALKLDGTTFAWSSTEMSNKKIPLTVQLRPSSNATTSATGNFSGAMTFTTTYQ